jgi:predicted nucleic acid-binding protein
VNNTFVDSSAWIELAAVNSPRHRLAKDFYLHLLQTSRLQTSDHVLSETYTRLRYDISHSAAVKFHTMITAAQKLRHLQVLWVDRAIMDAAWEILEKYADQDFSFVDCTSFVLMRANKIKQVFAFDDDSRVMGFDVSP